MRRLVPFAIALVSILLLTAGCGGGGDGSGGDESAAGGSPGAKVFADAGSQTITSEIAETQRQAEAAEVPGTPWFFIQVGDAEPYELQVSTTADFRAALDDALAT